jgi:multiple sugar transport system substrate-binding protein
MALVSRRRFLVGLGVAAAIPALQACGQAAPTATAVPAKPAVAAPTAAPAKPAAAAPTAAPAKPAAAAPTAVAAAAKPTAAPAAAKPAATTGVEIQVATRGGSDGEIMEKSVKAFFDKTGIKATHVAYGNEPEYWAKVQAMHATKQVADVVWASVGNFHNFANRGMLAELDPLIKADNYDMSDYIQAGLESLSLKGKLYGMPWGGHPGNGGLLYNLDMLKEAGVNATEDPTSLDSLTYDQLKEHAVKLTKVKDGRADTFGYAPGTDFLSLNNVLGAYGARFMTPDGTKLATDTKEFAAAMNWIRDMFVTTKASPAPGSNNGELFASGKLAMLGGGYGNQFSPGEAAIKGAFKWNVALQPKGPAGKRGTALTINGQTIASNSSKKEPAWQFVKWLMEPENHIPIVLTGGSRPALRKKVLEHPQLMAEMKAHKVFAKGIMEAEPWQMPANYRWPEFNSTVSQVFAGVWAGKETFEQALPEANKKLQAVLDKPTAD